MAIASLRREIMKHMRQNLSFLLFLQILHVDHSQKHVEKFYVNWF